MTEERFWELLGLLNWKKLGNVDEVVRPLVKALAALPVEDIFAFDDHLAAKLHALDTGTAYEQKSGDEYPHSPTPDYETFSNKAGWPSDGST